MKNWIYNFLGLKQESNKRQRVFCKNCQNLKKGEFSIEVCLANPMPTTFNPISGERYNKYKLAYWCNINCDCPYYSPINGEST